MNRSKDKKAAKMYEECNSHWHRGQRKEVAN
jgi:hypothetical protein